MSLLRKWASQTAVQDLSGSTEVAHELWSRNALVVYLTKLAERYISDSVAPFKERQGMKKMLMDAIHHYTTDFAFNHAMLLIRYIDSGESAAAEATVVAKALKSWRNLPPELLANCRIMAHLCANCTIDRDITVYRGFTDKRSQSIET